MLLTLVTFFAIPVVIGHGGVPAILLLIMWSDVMVAMWLGLFLFAFGAGEFPSRKGRTLIGLGVLVLAYAAGRIVALSEWPSATLLFTLPFAIASIGLLVVIRRPRDLDATSSNGSRR